MLPTSLERAAAPLLGDGTPWREVQSVVGPTVPALDALYVDGAPSGGTAVTTLGRRRALQADAGRLASFGTYWNSFPAAHWAHSVGSRRVRLRLEVDALAVLTVWRSAADAVASVVDKRLVRRGETVQVDVDIDRLTDGGLVWFALQAGPEPVRVRRGGWLVAEPVRTPGRLVLGMPTVGRPEAVAANLRRIAAAPALLRHVLRVVVVDQEGSASVHPDVAAALGVLGEAARIVRQPNLGGSGGYARIMHEALAEPGAAFVTLLDDDIELDAEALLRAYEFGRRTSTPTIVGAQMFDLDRPTVLEAAAEHIEPRTFWWCARSDDLTNRDLAATPWTAIPAAHRRDDADYAGWWTCQVPLEAVRRVGYPLPMFLKWDDVEYALRARAAGIACVSLPGTAVQHESWRGKSDSQSWQAFFHARNRLVAALLHGDTAHAAGVVRASLMLDVKQLLAMQYFAVARRHEGLRAVLEGPQRMRTGSHQAGPALRAAAASAPDQRFFAAQDVPDAPDAAVHPLAPATAPTGAALAGWASATAARHWFAQVDATAPPAARLSTERGKWWVVPRFDSALAPTADGAGYHWYRRDRAEFRRLLVESVGLHRRLRRAWPRLAAAYRVAAGALVTAEAWSADFTALEREAP